MSPAEQLSHIFLWIVSGACILLLLDGIWCQFRTCSQRVRKVWLPWALAAGLLLATGASFYMTITWADGKWRLYDLLAQAGGGALYHQVLKDPIRLIGRGMDLVFMRPLWKFLHLLVTIVRLLVRILVKFVATLYRLTYRGSGKIFPTTLQRNLKVRYTIGKPRRRGKPDESK